MKISSLVANIDYKKPEGLDSKFPDGMSREDASKQIAKHIPEDSSWQPAPAEYQAENSPEVDWQALKDELSKGPKTVRDGLKLNPVEKIG